MPLFNCDRLTPGRRTPVTFLVEASSGAEAARVADLLAYATGFVQGTYPDQHHPKPPDQWLLTEAEIALGHQSKPKDKPARRYRPKTGSPVDLEPNKKRRR